jgi:O-antigen ligase
VAKTKKGPTPGGRGGEATRAAGAARSGALEAAWTLLLAALLATPLLMTNTSWLPGAPTAWMHSGAAALKALAMQALVGAALASFAVALLRGEASVRWHRVGWLAAALIAWSGLTVLTSVSPATALVGYSPTAEGFLAILTYAAAGFLALQLADTPARIRTLLGASAAGATVAALYGLVQTLGLDPLKWQAAQWGAMRSFGTVGNPDMFGAFMVLNLFVLLGLMLSETEKRRRFLYGVGTFVVAVASFTSLARATWLGAFAGAIVFALLTRGLRPRLTRAAAVVAGALVLVVAVATISSLGNTDVDSNVARRAFAAFNAQDKNTLGRTETWRIALTALGDRPVFGYGPDTFGLAFQPRKTEAFASLVAPDIVQAQAHSSVIQIAVERGIPGAALWLALLAAVTAIALPVVLRGDDRGLSGRLVLAGVLASGAGYFVTSLLTPTSHESSLLLWCLLAVLVSPSAKKAEADAPAAASAVALAVGVLACAVAVAFLFADTRAAIADDDTLSPQQRMAAADTAVLLDPLNPEYAAVGAKAYAQALLQDASAGRTVARARFDRASALMRRSVALAPTDPHRGSTLVSLLLIGGQRIDPRYFAEAVSVAASVSGGAPNDLESAYWYARALNADGRQAEAVPVLERALRLRPSYADASVLLTDLKSREQ